MDKNLIYVQKYPLASIVDNESWRLELLTD